MDTKAKKQFDCEHCRFLRKSKRLSIHKDYCLEAKQTLCYVEKCPLIERANKKTRKNNTLEGKIAIVK